MVDVSEIVVGASIHHFVDANWRPLAFFSKTLKPTERKYSIFNQELLTVYLTIKHFHHLLEARPFSVVTKHKPLTFTLSTYSDSPSPLTIQHLIYILQFTTNILRIKGITHLAADALSHIKVLALSSTIISAIDLMHLQQRNGRTQSSTIYSLQPVHLHFAR